MHKLYDQVTSSIQRFGTFKLSVTSFFLLICLLSSSCRYNRFYPSDFTFSVEHVQALDLEEDGYWLSSNQDEIELYYTVAALNEQNQVVDGPKRRHYGPEIFSYRGQISYGYDDLALDVPAKGKVYFSVRLIENDDWSSVLNSIDNAQTIVEVAELASRHRKGTSSLAARALKATARRLNWAGLILTVVDIFDTNDQLLGVCAVLDQEELEHLMEVRHFREKLKGSGSNWGDRYDYDVLIALEVQRRLSGEIRERAKALSPNVILGVSPFRIDSDLNEFWSKSPDRLLERSANSDDDYNFSDGLYNGHFSANLGLAVTPAFRLNKRYAFGKFYLHTGYNQTPYRLDFKQDIFLSSSYFQNSTGSSADLSVGAVTLNLRQYNAALLLKLHSRRISWDIGGGMQYQQGFTRFNNVKVGNPNASFIYDEQSNVLEEDYLPFAFTKLGLGSFKRNKGYTLNFSLMAFKPSFTPNQNYGIFTSANEGLTNLLVPLSNPKWQLGYSFGLDVFF